MGRWSTRDRSGPATGRARLGAGGEARAEAGLLDPGTASVTLADGTLAATVPLANVGGVPAIFALAGEGNRNGNAIAVVDVSGSMGQTTPDGAKLIDTVKGSMIVMVQALNPGTKVGLWEFSYQLAGDAHHREIVPAGELSTTRDLLVGALSAMREDPDGGTALNSTVMPTNRLRRTGIRTASTWS